MGYVIIKEVGDLRPLSAGSCGDSLSAMVVLKIGILLF